MILAPANLNTIRTQPHGTQLYLSVYRPKTLLASRVTGSYSFGDINIGYYDVSTGTHLNVYADSVCLLGSTPDSDDVGRIRARSITNSNVTIAENTFSLVSGTYLTFLDYVDVVAVYPRILQDPANVENVIFYKDYDIPYSNQNTLYGSFPCAGPHRATFVSPTGTVFYSATGSYNVNGNPMSYEWAFEGGTPTGSNLHTPGYVAYSTPGHYRTRLIVRSSGTVGITTDTTYRFVSAYDRIGQGNSPPVLKWELNEFSGGRGEGGYSVGIKLFENLGAIEPNALIVIFSEDTYGTTDISLGGNAPNSSNIVFAGYVLRDSIKFNYNEGSVEFSCGSVTELMKQAEGFSVSCESKSSPSTWFQLKEMTIQKALYHYLKWHSTVLDIADFQYTGDDRLVQYFDSDRGSLYDAVNSFVETGLIGETVADRQGKIWSEISPSGYENPFASIPFNFTLLKQDWIGEPDITEKRTNETSVIEMGGIVYEGNATNGFRAYLTTAPSLTPYYRGKLESPYEGLILLSQSQLNQISGNYVANKNTNFGDVTLALAGNYRNIDIAPQERFFLDINTSDTLTPKSMLGLSFRPMSMNWQYDSTKASFYPQASFQPIVTGSPGQTLLIPPVPPEVGYSYSSFNLPPLPYFTPSPVQEQISRTVLFFDLNLGFIYTTDFDAVHPNYIIWNAGIDSTDKLLTDREFFITPNGSVWLYIRRSGSDCVIYRAQSVGSIFYKIIDNNWIAQEYPAWSDSRFIAGMGYNPNEDEQVAFIAGWNNFVPFTSDVNFWLINYPTITKGAACTNVNNVAGSMTFDPINLKWVYTGEQYTFFAIWDSRLWRFNANGSSLEFQVGISSGGGSLVQYQARARDTGRLYWWNLTDFTFWATEDNGTNIVTIGDGKEIGAYRWSYACDPSGQFLMGNWDVAANKGLSGDYGYSWTGLPTLPPGAAYVFAYCGGVGTASQWIAARGVVRYSPDFGNTWINKEGNLLQIAPIPLITGVFVKIARRTI